jgi:hypothetical protein
MIPPLGVSCGATQTKLGPGFGGLAWAHEKSKTKHDKEQMNKVRQCFMNLLLENNNYG